MQPHPTHNFWACFSAAWFLLPSGAFLEYGKRDDWTWAQVYYVWLFSLLAVSVAVWVTACRYFMIILSPVLMYALMSFGAEVWIFINQLDENGSEVIAIKRMLLKNCGFCSIFFLVLLQLFPWENLRLQTGP